MHDIINSNTPQLLLPCHYPTVYAAAGCACYGIPGVELVNDRLHHQHVIADWPIHSSTGTGMLLLLSIRGTSSQLILKKHWCCCRLLHWCDWLLFKGWTCMLLQGASVTEPHASSTSAMTSTAAAVSTSTVNRPVLRPTTIAASWSSLVPRPLCLHKWDKLPVLYHFRFRFHDRCHFV